jgi:hypothetical protein
VKTRLRPFAGLGLAQLVSTLAVCGVAALIAPPASVAADTVDVPAIVAADVPTIVAADTVDVPTIAPAALHSLPGQTLTAEFETPDVPDSDDDDGGDDAPTASAVVPSTHGGGHTFDRSWLLRHRVVRRASQVREGHALRGPPSDSGDALNLDDDDHLQSPDPTFIASGHLRPRPILRSQINHAISASDVPSMRAP